MTIRIAIPGDEPPQLQDSAHLRRLESYGAVTLYRDRPAADEEKVRRVQGAVCMINSRGAVKWPGAVLRELPELRMISVCGIGADAIDLAAAKDLGIIVCNIPGQTAPIVAEHALALMLGAARQAWFQTDLVKRGGWKTGFNLYLRGKTLGVIGAGSIGAEMIRLGKAVGMRVQAWTFHPSPERAQELGVAFVPLEELLGTSDVVSVHVKLTDATRGLIGRREIGLMKQGALFVNTARGAVVDNAALAEALHNGHLAGAGIDVFDAEPPPPDHPLLRCEQVVLTPHVADQNVEGMEVLNRGAVDNVIAYLEGRPQNRVV
ncbi:MAG: hydroxyacid dehydrogenase [Gemmataceae bacterium]|nr:hydroxyacid dehydrogenase [Gemmataceae bacterium]